MAILSAVQLKRSITEEGIVIKKHWGQHFLVSTKVQEQIINALRVERQDTVVELGAGMGALTGELACRCRRLIAIEKDPQ